jgi:hypothetical protein
MQMTALSKAGMLAAISIIGWYAACAHASGPFDGKWVGTAPEKGDCGVLTVTIDVVDGRVVSGSVVGNHGSPPIDWGFVQPNGFGKVQYSSQPTNTAQLTFAGNVFTGWFPTMCGRRAVSGSRTQ